DYGKEGLLARGRPIALPPGLRSLPPNRGIEALVFVPKGLPLAGTLIAISERGLDKGGNTNGFLIGGASPGNFAVRRSSNFDITDAALLPGGDVMLLERRFSWSSGLAVRMRRVALGEIKPGAVVDGPVLFDVDLGYEIDNMEGLSVHRIAGGETVLTLISDDNFSVVQRTLLLQFTLAEPECKLAMLARMPPAFALGSLRRRCSFLSDLPLQLERLRGQVVVLRLQQERIKTAAMIDRLECVRRNAQLDRAAERVR